MANNTPGPVFHKLQSDKLCLCVFVCWFVCWFVCCCRTNKRAAGFQSFTVMQQVNHILPLEFAIPFFVYWFGTFCLAHLNALVHESEIRVWCTNPKSEFGARVRNQSLVHESEIRVWCTRLTTPLLTTLKQTMS